MNARLMTLRIHKIFFIESLSTAKRLFLVICAILALCNQSSAQDGFNTYLDKDGRFSIEYPSTMTVDIMSPDELNFSHPSASLRMSLDIIRRPKKASKNTEVFVNAIKQNLKDEFKDVTIMSEGASSSDPSQLYLLYSFTDKRGVKLTQLTQVYMADERILQLTISDRSEGFNNLGSVIQRIRTSLKILKPNLV